MTPPDEFEELFGEHQVAYNITVGAKLLLLFFVLSAFIRIIQDRGYSTSAAWRPDIDRMIFKKFTIIVFGVSLPALLRTIVKPRPQFYLPTLLFFYGQILMLDFYPSVVVCSTMMEKFAAMDVIPSNSLFLSVRNFDCEEWAGTTVLFRMFAIVFSVFLWPTAKMVHINWLFIFFILMGYRYNPPASRLRHTTSPDIYLNILVLVITQLLAIIFASLLESRHRSRYASDLTQEAASWKVYRILEYMLPDHVVMHMLVKPDEVYALPIERASVLFVKIVDFDHLARRMTPTELLAFLNENFSMWDRICEKHGVTKIETVGEEYVAAVGVVPADVRIDQELGHEVILGQLVKVAADLIELQKDDVCLQLGLHTGPVIAGVIGQKLPRFRLFGDTINTAARMMQKGLPRQLQFGDATRSHLPHWVDVVPRGLVEMKGKGSVSTYLLGSRRYRGTEIDMRAQDASGNAREPLFPHALSADPADFRHSRHTVGYMRHSLGIADTVTRKQTAESVMFTETDGQANSPKEEFNLMLKKLAKTHADSVPIWQKIVRCGLRTSYFAYDREVDFHKWYYRECFCSNLSTPLMGSLAGLCILTVVEWIVWFVVFDCNSQKHALHRWGYQAHFRMTIFMTSRLMSILIICMWRWKANDVDWLWKNEKGWWLRPWRLSCSYLIICVLLFISYDGITYIQYAEDKIYPGMDLHDAMMLLHDHKRECGINSLMFVLTYCAIFLFVQQQLLFCHALPFLLLAGVLMVVPKLPFWKVQFVTDESLRWIPPAKYPFGNCGLYYSTTGMFVFIFKVLAIAASTYYNEVTLRSRFKSITSSERAQRQIHHILNTLMPRGVMVEIQSAPDNAPPPSHSYENATIAQSDLVGFTKLASSRSPQDVVSFLGELFGIFDEHTDKFDIYKVETVGDAYIAGQANHPLTSKNSAVSVIKFGLAMVEATQTWASKHGLGVSCRVGVHTGDCVGGIVGTRMQRYHLFGAFMTVLEVLESTSVSGRVQVSTACREAALKYIASAGQGAAQDLFFVQREGDYLETSKGERHDFHEAGGQTFMVNWPSAD